MAERNHFSAFADPGPDLLGNLKRVKDRQRDGLIDQQRAALLAIEAPSAVNRAILVIRAQNLIARFQTKRTRDDVQPVGDIGNEGKVIAGGVDERAQFFSGCGQQFRRPPAQEADRICLQLSLPVLIVFKHWTRHRAKAAVIQIDDLRVEQVLFSQMGKGQRKCHGQVLCSCVRVSARRSFSA